MKDYIYLVHSSNGELYLDQEGNVIRCEEYDGCKGDLSDILQFDLEEYRRYWNEPTTNEFDILDLGFWIKKPLMREKEYVAPDMEWRQMVCEDLGYHPTGIRHQEAATLKTQ